MTVLPLELSDLKGTKGFAREVLSLLGAGEQKKKLDFLLLNAAISGSGQKKGPWGWNEGLTVNHLCASLPRVFLPFGLLMIADVEGEHYSPALPDASATREVG